MLVLFDAVARHRAAEEALSGYAQVELDGAVPESPLRVDADVTLLEQAVGNVVYNAIRHNRAGGHVAVLLEGLAGDRFRLRVVDDGPGVPADELARLVERGFRSDAAQAGAGRTGARAAHRGPRRRAARARAGVRQFGGRRAAGRFHRPSHMRRGC
ncbi:ATP-binding protein [Nannocystis exedens]|uniref:ATP-binding protein n=1 Tax=Nannocystis exedens TaxID=54 RepID=UPI001FE4A51A|nr:ATP-binding protein [Nannocystis exedens]